MNAPDEGTFVIESGIKRDILRGLATAMDGLSEAASGAEDVKDDESLAGLLWGLYGEVEATYQMIQNDER